MASYNSHLDWDVNPTRNEWGEEDGGHTAESLSTSPDSGEGDRVSLYIDRSGTAIIKRFEHAPLSDFLIYTLEERFGGLLYCTYEISFRVNGMEGQITACGAPTWRGAILKLRSGASHTVSDENGKCFEFKHDCPHRRVLELFVEAKSLKMILSSREHGKIVYDFEMRGSREAIQAVCPTLFKQ